MLNAKVDSLVKIFGNLGNINYVSNPILICDCCGGAHMSFGWTPVEQAQFVSNFNKKQK